MPRRACGVWNRLNALQPVAPQPPPSGVVIKLEDARMLSRSRSLLLNAYHVLIDGLFDSIPIVLAFMVVSFGEGEKAVGVIVAAGTAVGTAAGLGTLFFSQRLGFMRTSALVAAAYGAGFFVAAFSGGSLVAGACFILAMAGHTVFHNIAFSYLAQNTERIRLGRVMSDFTAIGDVGRIPLVSLAAFAAAYSFGGFPGWRLVCLSYGAAALCAALWLFIASGAETSEQAPVSAHTGGAAASNKRRVLPSFAMLKEREARLAMLAVALNAFSNDRIFTFLPLLLMAKGIDPAIIGSFALGFSVGSFLGKLACGRFVDRFGSRRVFVIAQVLLAALLCVLLTTDALAAIVVIALLLGIVTKGTVPVIQAIITEPVPSTAYDDAFSVSSFLRGVINMLTPLLFGLLGSAWSMDAAYALMAVTALGGAVPILYMKSVCDEHVTK